MISICDNDKLCSLISEATSKGYSHILIMGDFNYPDIDWENWNTKGNNTNSHEYKFVETIQECVSVVSNLLSIYKMRPLPSSVSIYFSNIL
jgi:hypothetical protein